jgi:probable phosphoglycerate mutase
MPGQDDRPTDDRRADDRRARDPDREEGRRYPQVRFSVPPGATEILLVRHGESAPADPERPFPLVEGRSDPALAPEGRVQAEQLADRLVASQIDAIIHTPLRRTAETAAPLAVRLGIVPATEPLMIEVHLGEWEGGIYRKRIAEGDPLAAKIFQEERWDIVPGAESNESVAERVRTAIDRIAERHPAQRVVLVAHGGTIGAAIALASGSRPFAFLGSDNGAISTIVVSGDRWFVRGYNDRSHLD